MNDNTRILLLLAQTIVQCGGFQALGQDIRFDSTFYTVS
jgi:hypothetical protein